MTTIDRRTLTKGAAWAAPAITVCAVAPSLAASDTLNLTAHADKCPGASDVPGGWPKHGYRLLFGGTDEAPQHVSVVLNNGKPAHVVAGPTPVGPGWWEYVLDAKSSPSKLTVTVTVAGHDPQTLHIKARPHCGGIK